MINRVQGGLLLLFFTIVGVLGYNAWLLETTPPELIYTDFLSDLAGGHIDAVHLQGGEIRGRDRSGRDFRTFAPDTVSLMVLLLNAGVTISAEEPPTVINQLIPICIMLAIPVSYTHLRAHETF